MTHSRSIRSAFLWSYIGMAVNVFCQFSFSMILTRKLGSAPYGQMAIAMVPISFGALIANAGFGAGLIQRQILTNDLIRSCVWWQILFGVVQALLILLLSIPFVHLMHAEGSLWVLMCTAIVCPLNAACQIPNAILRRSLKFREIQLINIISMIIANTFFGIPLAIFGMGAWALVATTIAQSMLTTIMLWRLALPPWSLRRQPWPGSIGRFGGSVVGLNLANWGIANCETVVLSILLGPVALGAYNRLGVISTGLVSVLLPPLQSISLVHHSGQQKDTKKVRIEWMRTTIICAFSFLFLIIPMLIFPKIVIAYTLGPKMNDYSEVLRALSFAMVPNAMMCVCGPVLQALGHPEKELHAQVAILAITIPALLGAASTGNILVFTYMVAAIAWLRCLILITITVKFLWSPCV